MSHHSKSERPKAAPQPQDHLPPGGVRDTAEPTETSVPGASRDLETPQSPDTSRPSDATTGKLTRGADPTATRPHLEGAEQGPM